MRYSLVASALIVVLSLSAYGASVSGRVTDESGVPVASLEIYLSGEWTWESTFTTLDGEYRFTDLTVGWYYIYPDWSVIATPWEHEAYITSETDHISGLDFVIRTPPEPDASVSGRVTFSDGTPVVFVEIYAWGWTTPFDYETYTDSDGYYTLPLPGGDEYYMSCWYGGFEASPESYEFSISSGDSLTGYDFVMYPDTFHEEMVIVAYVMTEDYEGFPGVRVSCVDEFGWMPIAGVTDDYGEVYFYVSEPGNYYITPEMDGYTFSPSAETVYVDEWSTWVWVEFIASGGTPPPEFGIEVFAEDSAGAPVESLFIEWRPVGEGAWVIAMTDDDGYAYINLPSAGSYELNTMHPNPSAIITPPTMIISVDADDPVARADFTVHIPSSIDEAPKPEQTGISLSPNPFNSSLRISALGGANIEAIQAFDVAGRIVFDETFNYGRAIVDWTAPDGLPAGVYLLKITAGGRTFTAKAVFAK